ncbi:MAG: cupin domain-containing protein [Betaproteobacteria bacterium]
MNAGKPRIPYWHVWVDERGASRQTLCHIEAFAMRSIPGAAPQWQDDLGGAPANVNLSVLPVGWIGEWHENPKPQWIVPLSGRWFVETMDGQRVEMGPGEISFGEDQGCAADAKGRRGHLSGTVGDEPAVLMLVQLEQASTRLRPCRFR